MTKLEESQSEYKQDLHEYLSDLKDKLNPIYDEIIQNLAAADSKTGEDSIIQLDEWRSQTLPEQIATWASQRNKNDQKKKSKGSGFCLGYSELEKLMRWKLKRGKWRPRLLKLIQSNSPNEVEEVIAKGFSIILDFLDEDTKDELDEKVYFQLLKDALVIITKLRGVGPATASLILSLLHQCRLNEKSLNYSPPFLSDEAFYLLTDNRNPKYTAKEYLDQYVPIVLEISKIGHVSMDDVETMSFVVELYKSGKYNGDLMLEDGILTRFLKLVDEVRSNLIEANDFTTKKRSFKSKADDDLKTKKRSRKYRDISRQLK